MDYNQFYQICQSLDFLSNVEQQKALWLHPNNNEGEISSFDEEILYLYSNLQFKNFVADNKNLFPAHLFEELRLLSDFLYNFWDTTTTKYPDTAKLYKFLFNSEKWKELTNTIHIGASHLKKWYYNYTPQ